MRNNGTPLFLFFFLYFFFPLFRVLLVLATPFAMRIFFPDNLLANKEQLNLTFRNVLTIEAYSPIFRKNLIRLSHGNRELGKVKRCRGRY
jgi:hypothetical protein